MKKRFFITACVLMIAAIGFVIYALGHPEQSFMWSSRITHIFYGVYADIVMLMLVLDFWKNTDKKLIPVFVLELGAVFFLVQSILSVFPEGKPSWYLPIALLLNVIALFLNAAHRKNNKKDT